jgi:exoribonuclease R
VTVEGLDRDVYIDSQVARNRAFEGDIVIVQLNDKSKWKVVKKEEDEAHPEEEKMQDQVKLMEELFDDEEEEEEESKVNKVGWVLFGS